MPVRTPALCRKSVSQPAQTALASSSTGIWISDRMLRRHLERYHRIFLAPCRCLGSHAGPLESRRRLGKRNMAGLMPSTPVYPPLWHFHVASIPSAWQWEPPTTREERSRKGRNLSLRGLFDSFIRWLEKSDADKPFIEPPPLDDIGGLAQSVAGEAGIAIGDTPEAKDYGYPPDFPKEIVRLREKVMLSDEMDDDALHLICRACRRSLQRRIVERRQLSAEGLKFALDPFDEVVLSRVPDPKIAGKFAAMIRRTVLWAMTEAQREDPGAPFEKLWLTFAEWICASGGGHSNTQLFWRLLQGIPEQARDQIPSEQLFALTSSFLTDQAKRPNVSPHWVPRAQNFSEIYGSLGTSQREKLRADVSAFLAQGHQEEGISDTGRKMRFAWLVVQALDGRTTDEALARAHRDLICNSGLRVNFVQVWQLMAGRAQAHGYITKDALAQLMAAEDVTFPQRWANLTKAILGSPDGQAALRAMCSFLRDLGEVETAAHALVAAPSQQDMQVECAQALATASNDHRFALRLYGALERHPAAKTLLRQHFTWKFWVPYVKSMIEDAELGSPQIIRLLGLTRLAHTKKSSDMLAHDTGERADVLAKEEIAAKIELLDRMGHWYMQTTHLRDRQLLRRISECATIQRRLIDGVSGPTLANLALVIVKDLDNGKWGRTTRLEWLVRLIAQVQGQKEAKRVAYIFKGWRSVIEEKSFR